MAGKTKVQTQAQNENEALKGEINELKAMMMQFMQNQVNNEVKSSSIGDEKVEAIKVVEIDEYDGMEANILAPNKLINVTSLFTGGMTLIGNNNKHISFEKFGQTMPLTFEDLQYAYSNGRRFAEQGYYYIHNKDAVKLLYLQEAYKKIITAKEIEDFIKLPIEKMEEVYTRVTKNIKESILDVVVMGIIENKPEYSDRNKVDMIGKLSGKNMSKMVENIKEYLV